MYQLLLYELETPDGDEQTIRYISGNSIVNDSGQQSNSIDKFSLAKGYLQRLLQLELPRSFSKHILSTKKSSPVVEEFNSDSFGYIFDFYFDGKQTVFGNAKSLYYLGGDPAFLSREDFYSDDCRSNNGERVNIKLKQEYSTFVIVNPTLTWNVKDTVDSEPPLPKLVSFVLPKECLDNSREDFESSNDNKTKSKARAFSSSNLYGCTLIMYKRSENQTNVSNSPSNNEYSTNLSDDAGASSLPCKEVDSQTKNSTAADRSFIQDFMHKTEAVVSKQLWVDVTTNLSTVLTHGTAVASNYTNRFSFSHSFRSSNSTDDSLNNGVELKELPRTNKTTSNRNSFCENKDKDSSDSTRSTIMYSTSTTLHGSTEDMQQQLGKDNSSPKISLKTVLDITFSEQSSRTSNSSRQSSPDTNVGPVRYETFGTCILTDKPLILSLKLLLADVMLNSSDLPEAFAGSAFLTKDQQIQRLEQQVLSTDLEQGKSLSDMFINTSGSAKILYVEL